MHVTLVLRNSIESSLTVMVIDAISVLTFAVTPAKWLKTSAVTTYDVGAIVSIRGATGIIMTHY